MKRGVKKVTTKSKTNTSPSIAHTLLEKVRFSGIIAIWIALIVAFALAYFLIMKSTGIKSPGWEEDQSVALTNALINSISSITQFSSNTYQNPGLAIQSLMALESILGIFIYAFLFAKLVAYKQDTILEEIKEINQEETFTNYRRGLSLVRADILVVIEKIENKNLKPREVKDLWIIFSGLDQTLTNIKGFIMPEKKVRSKSISTGKFELILSSIKLTMSKVLELIKALNTNEINWKEEMLLTSIYYDIQITKDMIEHESIRTTDKKLLDKLSSTKTILEELEKELRATREQPKQNNENKQEEPAIISYEEFDKHNSNKDFEAMKRSEETQAVEHEEPQVKEESAQTSIEMHIQDPPQDPRLNHEEGEHKHHSHHHQ